MTIPCPICQAQVGYHEQPRPYWDAGLESKTLYRIECDRCRDFMVIGNQDSTGDLHIDPDLIAYLKQCDQATRTVISEWSKALRDNGCWLVIRKNRIQNHLHTRAFALKALQHYGLPPIHLASGGGFDDNALFIAKTTDARFTVRVYSPSNHPTEIYSELFWMNAVGQNTDVVVPKIVPAPDDSWMFKVSVKENAKPRYCVVCHYVEGQSVRLSSPHHITPNWAQNYGKSVAKMHTFSETFDPPEKFHRPRADAKAIKAFLTKRRVENPLADIGLLKALDELGEGPDVFGMLHTTLDARNVLICGEAAHFIDFNACCWGYYLAEIQQALDETLAPPLFKHFLEGYLSTRTLPPNFQNHIDIFRNAMKAASIQSVARSASL